jgi:hypothetical protein
MEENKKPVPGQPVPVDEEELNAAKAEAVQEKSSEFTYQLKKPLNYNSKEYTELHFDFSTLTGKDSLDVESELMAQGKGAVVVAALNTEYIIRIAARACAEPIGSDAFLTMSLFDFNKIKDKTRNFLLRSES